MQPSSSYLSTIVDTRVCLPLHRIGTIGALETQSLSGLRCIEKEISLWPWIFGEQGTGARCPRSEARS